MCFVLCEQYSSPTTASPWADFSFDSIQLQGFIPLDTGNDFTSAFRMVKQSLFAIILSKYNRSPYIWYDTIK